MRNDEIAALFSNIAYLLELKREMVFTVPTYWRAARAIDHCPGEVAA